MMELTCPKCRGAMRQYERSGVTVDQCTECRGVFLDRGELEKIFEAEANWERQQAAARPTVPPQAAPPPPPPPPGYGQQPAYGYAQPGYGGGYHGHYQRRGGYHGHNRRRRGFLGELFD